MLRSADKVMALSFRKGKSMGTMELIPPLISSKIKENEYHQGERDLCYFLNPGFDDEIMEYYRQRPELKADIFTDIIPGKEIPGNVSVHPTSREKFREAMQNCARIITTAGFDTVAEAFYQGIPIFLIPASDHYEQYCNALDASRTGLGFQLESFEDLDQIQFQPGTNQSYKTWADKIDDIFLKGIQ